MKKKLAYSLAAATIPLDVMMVHYGGHIDWLNSIVFTVVGLMAVGLCGLCVYMVFKPLFDEQERLHQLRMEYYRSKKG